jgi:GxxExxY protein
MKNSLHGAFPAVLPVRFVFIVSTTEDKGQGTTEPRSAQSLHRETLVDGMSVHINQLTREVIGAAIEVHKTLGPGLLESAYRKSMCRELLLRHIPFRREWPLPLEYKGLRLEAGYRVDIIAADRVLVECKSVTALAPIHEAQLLTYLRLGGWRVGLLINFNVVLLKHASVEKLMVTTTNSVQSQCAL